MDATSFLRPTTSFVVLPYEPPIAAGLTDLAFRLGMTATNLQLGGSAGSLEPLTQRFDFLRQGGIPHLELARTVRCLREGADASEGDVDVFLQLEGRIWGTLAERSSIPERERYEFNELVAGRGELSGEGVLQAHRWTRRPFLEGLLYRGEPPKSGIKNTPLIPSDLLAREFERPVYVKAEGRQVTRSLKARGSTYVLAVARLLGRHPERTRVVAPSLGNHAFGLIEAARNLGFARVEIVLPIVVRAEKEARLRRMGAIVRRAGKTLEEADTLTRYLLEDDPDVLYLSPFDHPLFAMALGTIGVEIDVQMRRVHCHEYAVIAPAGTGGFLAGLVTYLGGQDVPVYGVQPQAFSNLYRSFHARAVIDQKAPDFPQTYRMTLADNLAIERVGPGTFAAVRNGVKGMAAATETALSEAMTLMDAAGFVSEGAAALPAAALLTGAFEQSLPPGLPVVLVHTGENVGEETLGDIARRTRASQEMAAVSASSRPTPVVPPPDFDGDGNPRFGKR